MEEEKIPEAGEVSIDALEAAFSGDEVVVIEEEIVFLGNEEEDEEEDDVDLAFHEDEGYW